MTERLVYILSGSIVFAGLWIGGFYSVSGGNGDAHVINRITGTIGSGLVCRARAE